MLDPRTLHAAVYHSQHLYIVGGSTAGKYLRECERYVYAERRWEALPPLPRACHSMSGVVLERSLYALGGSDGTCYLNLVQKLSLDRLTWELKQMRLPFPGASIPCFKVTDTEAYLVVDMFLCSLTALEVLPVKYLREHIYSR
jgi:hypothetical protein